MLFTLQLSFFGSFFFFGYVFRLSFYSFPTRRSSDLLSFGLVDRHTSQRQAAMGTPELVPVRAYPWPDRKSTRLNSSHVKISYAVFCLKKKKNKFIINYFSIKIYWFNFDFCFSFCV